MQSTITTILTAAVRAVLQGLAGWLIAKGLLTPEQDFSNNVEIIGGIVTFLVTLGWMAKVKVDERRKLNTAAASDKAVTLDQVERKVQSGTFAPAMTPTNQVPVIVTSTGDGGKVDPKRFVQGILVAIALGSLAASSCATTAKNPTPVQQASARQQTADVVDRLTTAIGLADGVTQSLTASSLAPQVKIEIGCGILKVVGRDTPTPTITQQCGALPTRALSPFQKASDAAQALTTCASRQNTIAVLFDLLKPIWERLERSTDRALQVAGAALRLVLLPVQTTCGGVA
jgi:hypothetical protein